MAVTPASVMGSREEGSHLRWLVQEDTSLGPWPYNGSGTSPGLPRLQTSAYVREDKASVTWASHSTQPNLNLSTDG